MIKTMDEIIEEDIINLSKDIEKLLEFLKISLEGKCEDNNSNIKLASDIFNRIDKIKKDMNKYVDSVYSKNSFEYVPINFEEINDKINEKKKELKYLSDKVFYTEPKKQ